MDSWPNGRSHLFSGHLLAYTLYRGYGRDAQHADSSLLESLFDSHSKRTTDMSTKPETAVSTPAYFVAEVEIYDPAGFQSYAERFQATLLPFGGRLVSFGASIVPLEGIEASTARAAIVVFPGVQACRDWFASPGYREIAPIRQKSTHTRAFYVEGLPVSAV
jgi:uncharacterized protein (DUF1330 family)